MHICLRTLRFFGAAFEPIDFLVHRVVLASVALSKKSFEQLDVVLFIRSKLKVEILAFAVFFWCLGFGWLLRTRSVRCNGNNKGISDGNVACMRIFVGCCGRRWLRRR